MTSFAESESEKCSDFNNCILNDNCLILFLIISIADEFLIFG